METQSNSQLEEFVLRGKYMFVYFNERITESTDEEPAKYTYQCAKFLKSATIAERIEAIIGAMYPTYGSELAAINSADEEKKTEYMAFREQAKLLALRSFV